jgi:hypothetical protein
VICYDKSGKTQAKQRKVHKKLSKDKSELAAEVVELQEKVDILTRLLCELCSHVDAHGGIVVGVEQCSNELNIWWRKHKQFDEERLKERAGQIIKELDEEGQRALELYYQGKQKGLHK